MQSQAQMLQRGVLENLYPPRHVSWLLEEFSIASIQDGSRAVSGSFVGTWASMAWPSNITVEAEPLMRLFDSVGIVDQSGNHIISRMGACY